MENHINLEDLARNEWDVNTSLFNKVKSFGRECRDNFEFEWKCILACELGDIAGVYSSINTSVSDWANEIGLATGILTGLSYAYHHTSKDAKAHDMKPSFSEAAIAAGSAELGCVTAATGAVYLMGKYVGAQFGIPSWEDLSIRALALIPALPIGLLAMSSLTFPKKKEAGRIVSEKGALNLIYDGLKEQGYDVTKSTGFNGVPRVSVSGQNTDLIIEEKRLPEIYNERFDISANSMYRVVASSAKYSSKSKISAEGVLCEALTNIEMDHEHVKNPFIHDSHSHSHKH